MNDEVTLFDPARAELERLVEVKGTKKAVAVELEVAPSLLTQILKGRLTVPPAVLDGLGFERLTVNVRPEDRPAVIRAINAALRKAG